jgi:hypothetical protein
MQAREQQSRKFATVQEPNCGTQHRSAGQTWPVGQLVASQTQVPLVQTGVVPLQVVVQVPQWLASLATQTPPQQSWPLPQLPQLMVPPQPSDAVPQFWPDGQDVAGVQPHWSGVPPPPQVSGAVQLPQFSVPPQPSGAVPQFWPAGQLVAGVQPHWPAVPPPPQVWGGLQAPQVMVPPQPSGAVPQFWPDGQDVAGVQPQTLAVPPPAQVWGAVQLPQLSVPPQPSEIVPQSLPWAAQVVGAQQAPAGCWTWPLGQQTPPLPATEVLPGAGVQLPEQHWPALEQALPVRLHSSAPAGAAPARPSAPSTPPSAAATTARRERRPASRRASESKRSPSMGPLLSVVWTGRW